MTELNIDKIYSKFRDIREAIDRLTAFKDISLEEFLNFFSFFISKSKIIVTIVEENLIHPV